VYALRGIAYDRAILPVDYNLEPRQLFCRVAQEYVRRDQTLPLLFAPAIVRRRKPGWPSWLPDWSSDIPDVAHDRHDPCNRIHNRLMSLLESARHHSDSTPSWALPCTSTTVESEPTSTEALPTVTGGAAITVSGARCAQLLCKVYNRLYQFSKVLA